MNHRSQKRVQSAVPVRVSGKDARGEELEEFTDAVDVSRRGLSFLSKHDWEMLSMVNVVAPGRGPTRPGEGPADFYSQATVVRVTREGDVNRVALRFVGATLPVYTSEST